MAEVIFSHPRIHPDLNISVKPDQVTWAYGLNTAVYPTYGGEVIQILSVFFDDMTIAGTVATVHELERIYAWFIRYMQVATQGKFSPSFNQQPVIFHYPERGWKFQIWPKSLPGFTYGRDIVAPQWQLQAAVKEPDATFADQIKDFAVFNAAHKGQFDTFGKATADFGVTGDLENNPWGSPSAPAALDKGATINSYISQQSKQLADTFNGFVQSYTSSDLTKLPQFQDFSKPATTAATKSTSKTKKGQKTKK